MKKLLLTALLGGMTSCASMTPATADNTKDIRVFDFYCHGTTQARAAGKAMLSDDAASMNLLLENGKTGKGCAFFSDIFGGNPARGEFHLIEVLGDSGIAIYGVRFPNGLTAVTVARTMDGDTL